MCGIAGYIGEGNAVSKIFDMLKRLEYRGYDSAGIAFLDGGLQVVKDRGKVDEVRRKSNLKSAAKVALGHSRWATHGAPSQENAHPHTDCKKEVAIVHNGIIENYAELREELRKKGHKFSSETDSEVIAHLIEAGLKTDSFENSFAAAMKVLEGSFAVLAVYEKEPNKILFARNESPLLAGIGKGGNLLASDMPAILSETKSFIIIGDMEYGVMYKDLIVVKSLKNGKIIKKPVHTSDLSAEAAEKGCHEHYMLKEILEESLAVKDALRSKAAAKKLAGTIRGCENIYLVACGTAWHASMVGKYLLQEYGINAAAEVASEFRYSTAKGLDKKSAVIAISQSGETADTLAAAKEAKRKGAKVIAVVNVVGSSLTRVADETLYTYSGPEIAVASTKVYLGQITALTLLILELLKLKKKISAKEADAKFKELEEIPAKIDSILDNRERIKEVAKLLERTNDYFYVARRLNYPTALEGALKLKEISYLHAEAYPGGELKHGPLALMEEKVCVVAINPDDDLRKKMESNIQEIRSRKAKVLELVEGDVFGIKTDGETKIIVPKTDKLLTPLTMIVPLHLLAYYVALAKGLDIDKPRNLAKSVTVE
jgi:glucosamine--fructose-6-phosphate aminotransferase (isomerizing)